MFCYFHYYSLMILKYNINRHKIINFTSILRNCPLLQLLKILAKDFQFAVVHGRRRVPRAVQLLAVVMEMLNWILILLKIFLRSVVVQDRLPMEMVLIPMEWSHRLMEVQHGDPEKIRPRFPIRDAPYRSPSPVKISITKIYL